jgi:hypothetical protein
MGRNPGIGTGAQHLKQALCPGNRSTDAERDAVNRAPAREARREPNGNAVWRSGSTAGSASSPEADASSISIQEVAIAVFSG